MKEDQTHATTVAALDPRIRDALCAMAKEHDLPADLSDTIACCVTTIANEGGLLAKIFGFGGPKTSVVVLTQAAFLWAVATTKKVFPNGARLRDIDQLASAAEMPQQDPYGLHVHGNLFRGASERASAYVALGPGDASDAFRKAVTQAVKR